jgi:hypothetical protein
MCIFQQEEETSSLLLQRWMLEATPGTLKCKGWSVAWRIRAIIKDTRHLVRIRWSIVRLNRHPEDFFWQVLFGLRAGAS